MHNSASKIDDPALLNTSQSTAPALSALPARITDITGALSRESLQLMLLKVMQETALTESSASLIMLDLDYFKTINDAFGHNRGDEVLVEFVETVKRQLRSTDHIFRYGGDEFVVLMRDTTLQEADMLARSLLNTICSKQFDGNPPISLSLSGGVAAYPAEAADSGTLLALADRRAYKAKRAGRGRVCSGETSSDDKAEVAHNLLSQIRQSRLIERDIAQETVRRFLADLPGMQRGLLSIEGQPGSGVTRFLQEASILAQLRGYETIVLRGSRDTAKVSFAPVTGSTFEHTPVTATETASADAREAVCALLLDAQKNRQVPGLIVILDQVDLADTQSLELVLWLLESSEDIPIGLVCDLDAEYARRLLGLQAPGIKSIHLRPLSSVGLSVWLRSLLRTECSPLFVEWLYRETDGLPSYVQKALMMLVERSYLACRDDGSWTPGEGYASLSLRSTLGLTAPTPGLTPTPPAPTPSSGPARSSLPSLPYSFIGRDRETSRLKQMISEHRMVTITGPGGVGKTHLALHVAGEVLSTFSDGVFFLPLASVRETDFVVTTIAQVFGLKAQGEPISQILIAYMARKHMLLVLDNFEQVVAAAPLLADLMRECPDVHFLVTSREALHVRGEHIFPLTPLALPSSAHEPLERLHSYPAVALFVERATAANPNFELTRSSADEVIRICAQLDGLPLAIELVAARLRTMNLKTIMARLDSPQGSSALHLLTSGPRDLPQRHQTMRDTIRWSFELLEPEEQRLFAYLGLFSGGFTLAAVEEIFDVKKGSNSAGVNNEIIAFGTPLQDLVTLLLSKSLIQYTDDARSDEPRYMMLETIREYAREQFAADGEVACTTYMRKIHAHYYMRMAEESEAKVTGSDQKAILAGLALEHGNMRVALEWSIKSGDADAAVRIAGGLWRFWWLQGYAVEGRIWIDKSLAMLAGEITPELALPAARALHGAGVLARSQCDYDSASQALRKGLELASLSGDVLRSAALLNSLGLVELDQGHYAQAEPYFVQSMTLEREIGDRQRLAVSLNNLGGVAHYQGLYQRAQAYYEESLALRRELGDNWGIANSLYNLGEAAYYLGSYEESASLHGQSLQLREDLGDVRGMPPCFEGLAGALASLNMWEEAASLFGFGEALREQCAIPLSHSDRAQYSRMVQNARSTAPPEDFERAWYQGRNISLALALRAAFAWQSGRTADTADIR